MKNTLFASILFCCLFLLMKPSIASAQKNCNLALSIFSPVEGEEFAYGDTIDLYISLKNLGPDVVDSSDDVFIFIEGVPTASLYNKNIAVGDSVIDFYARKINIEGVDSVLNTCLYLDKELNTSIIDTVQGNDTACVNILLKGGDTRVAKPGHSKAPLKLYPNPACSKVMLSWDVGSQSQAGITVRDVTGRHLFRKNYGKFSPGHQTLTFDISTLQPGIYFIELNQGTERRIGKLLVE